MEIIFHGAAREDIGSCHLVSTASDMLAKITPLRRRHQLMELLATDLYQVFVIAAFKKDPIINSTYANLLTQDYS